ncbi:MAG: hypothetical protein HQ481_03505 [Alphaproteobacteria bacterium]|nr:hypothetical protein [Alphaproteobacteria bacterium]
MVSPDITPDSAPDGAPDITAVACIGGGVIGGGWAARFLIYGVDVVLHDPHPDARRAIDDIIANAQRANTALGITTDVIPGRLTFASSIAEAVSDASYVQESVPERLELKHRIFAEIETAAAPDTLIGSSTSGFTPSALRDGLRHPERLIVAHPFNPVYLLPLVELVGGPGSDPSLDRAALLLERVGMFPLRVRREIDAHIADRLLEAVWREALWLVKDGVATTAEIDDAIRMGFGLRWAQMGLFESYRIAGGEAGMRHFLQQFGPALKWPWTKLMDVPELDDSLIDTIVEQSDAQSGGLSIRALERVRDDNLVAILQALRLAQDGAGWGAGAVLNRTARRATRTGD